MMENSKVANQMISFQKTLFENSFNAMCTIQEQTEKIAETFLKQMTWIPEEGKKSIRDSFEMYKKARDTFKKTVDDGYTRLEEMLDKK
ncbi:MAG: hypothetical protein V2I97_09585 [Desulfococcaceae bacterium]|jgi:hypothetical protein|nr:hypothetical protein [Desulfococcaceae bacterium]